MTQVNFKKWNRITVGDCLTFPVKQQRFQVLVLCWAATKRLPLDTRNTSGLQENVFGNQFIFIWFVPKSLSRDSSFYDATGSIPVHIGTGTLIARDEDLSWGTFPMPTFARRPSTMSLLFPVDIPRNSTVGQQRQQISELQFDKFHTLSTFLSWKIRIKSQAILFFCFSIRGYVMVESLCSSFSFNMWQIVHYIDIDICTLTQSLPCWCPLCCLFFSSSAYLQTGHSSVVQHSSGLVHAHGSNRPWVQFVFSVFAKRTVHTVILISYMVAEPVLWGLPVYRNHRSTKTLRELWTVMAARTESLDAELLKDLRGLGKRPSFRWKRCRVPRLSIQLQNTHEPRQFLFLTSWWTDAKSSGIRSPWKQWQLWEKHTWSVACRCIVCIGLDNERQCTNP